MDRVRKQYTKVSRSRSRKRSGSKPAKSCITQVQPGPARSEIQAKPVRQKVQGKGVRREKDTRTELSHGPLRQGKFRKLSPDDTTKCTREEDLNIDQFLMDDLVYINKEEAKLQQEILVDHKNTILKVKAVEMKNKIDTRMVSTKQMVKKLNDLDPYETMTRFDLKNETEEQIEESLENLNYLLAQNNKSEKEKKRAYKKMAEKMNIRLDSTSPVRQVPWNPGSNRDKGNINPFAYEPVQAKAYNEYEVPNFKPRSMVDGNDDAITGVTKPKSVVTAITSQGRGNNKLLGKDKGCQGSYLNAQVLEVSLIKFYIY